MIIAERTQVIGGLHNAVHIAEHSRNEVSGTIRNFKQRKFYKEANETLKDPKEVRNCMFTWILEKWGQERMLRRLISSKATKCVSPQ